MGLYFLSSPGWGPFCPSEKNLHGRIRHRYPLSCRRYSPFSMRSLVQVSSLPVRIRHCFWLYFRYCLSYRDVEEMMAERGVVLTYESICRWCLKFGQTYANRLRQRRCSPATSGIWTRCSSPSTAGSIICGAPSISAERCWTSWCRARQVCCPCASVLVYL